MSVEENFPTNAQIAGVNPNDITGPTTPLTAPNPQVSNPFQPTITSAQSIQTPPTPPSDAFLNQTAGDLLTGTGATVNQGEGSIGLPNSDVQSQIAYNLNNINPSTTPGSITTGQLESSAINSALNGAPVYNANSTSSSTTSNNPNARLAQQAKDPTTKGDPNAEINKGGKQNHQITKQEIQELERQTNLTLYPYIFGGELARIKHQFSGLNLNRYYLLLNLLVYGFDNKILQSGTYGHEACVIDQTFLNDFIHMAKIPQLQNIIKKTPAYQKGCFNDIGKLGTTQANAQNMPTSPVTGPKTNQPGLVSELLERIHPGLVQSIDNFCNNVRTKAYMSLPRTSFAALQSLVSAINGIVSAFQQIVYSIYNGIMYYIQQISGIINGLIAKIQQLLMMFLEKIIPPDLLCILYMLLQKFLSDSKFFQSIANFENAINKFQQKLEDEVNKAFGPVLALANNPFGAISKHFSPEVNQIISMVFSVANNPDSYLGGFLSNFGYGMAAEESQPGIIEQFDQIFSPLYSSMSPIGKILKARSSGSNDTSAVAPQTAPQSPSSTGPILQKNGTEDIYGKPVNKSVPVNQASQGSGGGSSPALSPSAPFTAGINNALGETTPGIVYKADGSINYNRLQ
jgi:hypothetical protein